MIIMKHIDLIDYDIEEKISKEYLYTENDSKIELLTIGVIRPNETRSFEDCMFDIYKKSLT